MIGLAPAQFEETFPFHFAVNKDLGIVQAGPSLRKLCGFDPVGSNFCDLFEVSHPSGTEPDQRGFLENAGLLFILNFKPKNLPFRGEFTTSDSGRVLLFLGSPWLVDQPRLSELGLSLSDFALHDSLTDLIHLIETQRTSLEESAVLARKLKEQQTALAEAHREAENANRAKSMFLANMSHELRTPLNSILGFAQLMACDPEANTRQRDRLDTIQRSGEHLLDLLNDLLDMSKIEAGTTSLVSTPFDTSALFHGIEDMFRQRADAKQVRFTMSLNADVPKTVVSDVRKIRQILLNLVGNALKFTDVGSVALHASWHPDGLLEIEVKDTGPGIAPENLEAIFKPFERGDQEESNAEGAGLGLAICKRFVDHMGGSIQVESRIGEGSTFTASIPLTVENGAVSPLPSWSNRLGAGNRDWRIAGKSPRVLVVDDDRNSRNALVALLRNTGIAATSGANGREAVALQSSWRPDLIFMDIRMPGVDGAEACEIIKRRGSEAPVIIFLTASYYEKQDLLREDFSDGWLLKPFRFSEVIESIETHLDIQFERHPGEPDAAEAAAESNSDPAEKRVSAEILRSLAEACAHLEFSAVQDSLKKIQGIDPETYGGFSELAADFRYEELEQLVRRMIAPAPERDPGTAAREETQPTMLPG